MRRIRDRVAGLDVHRDSVTACVELFDGCGVEIGKERFATTAVGVRALGEWLAEREVELVVMEATGVYWKPIFYPLEGLFEEVAFEAAEAVKVKPFGRQGHSPQVPHPRVRLGAAEHNVVGVDNVNDYDRRGSDRQERQASDVRPEQEGTVS